MKSLLFLGAMTLSAQSFYPIGNVNDRCGGENILTTPNMRYGTFTCVLPAGPPGQYSVKLTFVEPSFSSPTDAAGNPQRLFNVSLNGYQALTNFQPLSAGGTLKTPLDIPVDGIFSIDGNVTVKVTTVVRNGILSAVTITPKLVGQACKTLDRTMLAMQLPDGSCVPLLVITPSGLAQIMTDPKGLTIYPSGALVPLADVPQWGGLAVQDNWNNFSLWLKRIK